MSEQGQEKKERYKRVRGEFDDLDTEDKVLFLMEATVSTIARGVDEFGRAVSDELNKAFSRRAERKSKSGSERATGTAGGATSTGSTAGSSSTDAETSGSTGSSTRTSDAPSDNGFGDNDENIL